MPPELALDEPAEAEEPTGAEDDVAVDEGIDLQTDDDPDPAAGEGQQTEESPAQAPAGEEKALIQGGKLSEEAKATIAKIQAENPQLAKSLTRALFSNEALRKEFPGGVKDAVVLKNTLAEVGGVEGLQKIRGDLQEFTQLDGQYANADPRFVETLANQSPESFLRLAPAIIEKFAAMNQEGFGAMVSQVFVSDMNAQELPIAMKLLGRFIGDNPDAIAEYNKIVDYVGRIGQLAKGQVTKPAAKASDADAGERQKFEQEREAFQREQFTTAAGTQRSKVYEREMGALLNGRKVSDQQKEAIRVLYATELQKSFDRLPKFGETLQKFFGAKDQNGFLRYLATVDKAEVPKALRKAIDAVLPARPGPQKKAPAAPGAAPIPGKPGETTPTGYVWRDSYPAGLVDLRRTTADMLGQNKAILKDGSKVYWK